mgnify:CR=1 FL=1|tara:strand:- start:991 stop:1365 length:375 start_codon:yes stop_codon:yes gene_type:complete
MIIWRLTISGDYDAQYFKTKREAMAAAKPFDATGSELDYDSDDYDGERSRGCSIDRCESPRLGPDLFLAVLNSQGGRWCVRSRTVWRNEAEKRSDAMAAKGFGRQAEVAWDGKATFDEDGQPNK